MPTGRAHAKFPPDGWPFQPCLVLVLGILTNRQVHYWHDTESFWIRTIALTNDNYVAHGEFAAMLHEQGRTEEAMEQIRAVLAIHPNDAPANLVVAEYERSHGNLATAIERYQIVTLRSANASTRARAYTSLGYAYRQMGEPTKAKQAFETSLQLSPGQPPVMVALGVIEDREGDVSAAVRQFSHAMALQPTDVGYLLLAHALQQDGRVDEANKALERAAQLSRNLPQAQMQAASLLAGR